MNFFKKIAISCYLVCIAMSVSVWAEETTEPELNQANVATAENNTTAESNTDAVAENTAKAAELASQLATLKQQVLTLNRELFILEEDLLFPASTQIAVFVSVDIGRFFTLDSVELKVNGQAAAGFLYTDKQRKALEQGGIQRLYQANIKTGEHELTAIFYGTDHEQRAIKRAASYTFSKEDDAVMLELKLEDNTSNYQADIVVEEWVL